MTPELAAKRLELLTEIVPGVSRVAVLWDPGYSDVSADWRELRATARTKGVMLQPVEARDPADLDRAFATMARERAEALITFSDTMTYNHANQIAELALKYKLPLMSPFRETADVGALMSYGPSIPDLYRRAAGYVDKILKGLSPLTYQSNSRRSSNSWSTSRPRRASASPSRPPSSPAPTRGYRVSNVSEGPSGPRYGYPQAYGSERPSRSAA